MLFNPFSGAFGLEISDSSLKLVGLRKNFRGRLFPHTQHTAALPEGAVVRGEIEKPEEVVRVLKALLIKGFGNRLASPWVVASLPEPKTFYKMISFEVSVRELTDALVREAVPSHIPAPLEELTLSWEAVGAHGGKSWVAVGATATHTADLYAYTLESAGLRVLALDLETLALARALLPDGNPPDEAVALLDIGATRAHLVVVDWGKVQFTLVLPFSGELLTNRIAETGGISREEAEEMKRACTLDVESCDPVISAAVTPVIETLAAQVKEGLTFFREHFEESHQVHAIILSGGGANVRGLDRALASAFKRKVTIGNPWAALGAQPAAPKTESLPMAVSCGLALRAFEIPLDGVMGR